MNVFELKSIQQDSKSTTPSLLRRDTPPSKE
jgi:hypothetical protein